MATSAKIATRKKFQSWRLEGNGKIVGEWPLPDAVEPDQYVELGLDGAGQIVRILEFVEGHEKPLVRRPHFEGGKLRYSDYDNPIARLKGRNCYEYDSRGFLKARQELKARDQIRFRIEINCDAEGRIRGQRLHDHNKRFKERVDYEYDDAGRHHKDIFYKSKDISQRTGTVVREHDDRDRVVRQTWHDGAGEVVNAFTYAYDEPDRVVEMAVVRDGDVKTRFTRTYDDRGKRQRTVFLDASGAELSRDEAGPDGERTASFESFATRALGEDEAALTAGTATLAEIAQFSRRDIRSMTHVAYFWFEKGQYERAREMYETLSLLEPDEVPHMAGVAACALADSKPQIALNWYDQALTRDPGHLACLAGRAEALIYLGRTEEGVQAFQHLFEVAPDPADPVMQRAREVLTSLGKALH